ncbi:MAG: AI-2E family transporter [Candidatus Absconditabacteria bacterium]
MNLIKNIFDNGNKFIKTLSKEDQKELAELQRLEDEVKELQEVQKKQKKEVRITNRDMIKFWFFAMIMAFLGYVLFSSLDILYLILAAYIVSIAIEAVIVLFEHYHLSRSMSILISYLLLVIFLLSGFVLIVPFVINELTSVINILLAKLNTIQALLQTQTIEQTIASIPLIPHALRQEILHMLSDPATSVQFQTKIQTTINQFSSAWKDYAQSLGTFAVNMLTGVFTSFAKGGIVITLSVLFSIEKISVMKFISSLGGEKKFKYIYTKLEKIYKQLGIWLKSRLLLSVYIGLAMYVSLWIMQLFGMDIPSKLSLSIILGLLDIVPYIGPFVGGIPAVLIGLTHYGAIGGLIMAGIILFINTIESNILIPFMMNKSLGINSVVIFISMILGGIIMGFLGILLAVPIAAIITLLFEKDIAE